MVHVAVIGAAGGIGQSLSLLLKNSLPHNAVLSLYDVIGAAGVAADLSHIDTPVQVKYAQGKLPTVRNDPALAELAIGVDVFVVVAGVPRKPGMTRDDLFKVNAGICLDIVQTCGKASPKACFCIVTNPVNSTVPIAAQALKKLGIYDCNRLFGVCTLDHLRATQFVNTERAPYHVETVPVVGGHSDVTIVPLLSQLAGPVINPTTAERLTQRTQVAGTEVVKAKAGKGSATLSMAAAGARFTLNVVKALTGQGNPIVYTYVDTQLTQDITFLAIPVMLGVNGIEKRLPIGKMTEYENKLLAKAKKVVEKNIEAGETFAKAELSHKSKL